MKKKGLHKKDDGFKLPEGYFDDFEDRFFNTINKDSGAIPRKSGFNVPDGYFETLDDKLIDQLNQSKNTKVVSLHSYRKYYYTAIAIAASIVLILVIRSIIVPDNLNAQRFDIADLDQEEIESYINTNDFSLNAYDIAQVFDDVSLEEIDVVSEEIKDDELIDYLQENINTYDQLINEN